MLTEIARDVPLTVYTQDDPGFPAGLDAVDDTDLTVSWHHGIEAVPTLLRVEGGVEVERSVAVDVPELQRLMQTRGVPLTERQLQIRLAIRHLRARGCVGGAADKIK